MTDTGAGALRTPGTGARSTPYTSTKTEVTGWVGWVVFGAIMLMMIGAFQIIEGLVALFNDDFYVVTQNGLVVNLDYTTWGWVHLILGVLAVVIGFGVIAGNMAAQVAGIVLASISAIVNLTFIPAYPVWSIVIIALDVVVIYALAVHGREMKSI